MSKKNPFIGADIKYKRKRATVDQKALKQVITEMAKKTTKAMKADAKMFKDTGALGFGIGAKVVDPKKQYLYMAIVGVKNTRYSKQTKKGLKVPNKYAAKVNKLHHFIERNTPNLVGQLILQSKVWMRSLTLRK